MTNSWKDFKAQMREDDGVAREILDLAETTAQITGALYTAREEKKISQRELARLAGVAQSVVARFETGETTPRLDTLVKLLSPLGLKLKAVSQWEESLRYVYFDSHTVIMAVKRARRAREEEENMEFISADYREVRANG